MSTVTEKQAEVFQVNTANGWFDTERTPQEDIALIHSEVAEVLEAYRKHGLTPWVHVMKSDFHGVPAKYQDVALELPFPDYQGMKPEGVGSELADIQIRILDYCQRWNNGLEYGFEHYGRLGRPHPTDNIGDNVCILHSLIDAVYVQYQNDSAAWVDVKLAAVWIFTSELAAHYGMDLEHEFAHKLAYNRKRGYRHGNKLL
jgi:NTP pyrophosphatase (non-canonical NTP hydrolase)